MNTKGRFIWETTRWQQAWSRLKTYFKGLGLVDICEGVGLVSEHKTERLGHLSFYKVLFNCLPDLISQIYPALRVVQCWHALFFCFSRHWLGIFTILRYLLINLVYDVSLSKCSVPCTVRCMFWWSWRAKCLRRN